MLNESDAATRGWLAFLLRHKLLVIVVLVLLGGGAWFVYHAKQQNAASARPRFGGFNNAVAVSVATVQTGDIVVRIPALGAVSPITTVTVKPQVSGILQEVAFKEGQMVRKGDFLALIDPRPYEASLSQAKAALTRDEALLANDKLNLDRYEDLIKQDSVSQQQVDTQRATVAQDEGNVASDKAQVKTAELNLGYTRITSPVTGRVGLRQVDQGNYVTTGDANGLVVITQLQPISTLFSVPEDNIAAIMAQIKAGATLRVEASDRSDSHQLAVGHLATTDNLIDATTGTLKLRAMFDNTDNALFPGQFVNVQLVVDTLKNQVIVPTAAVRRGAPNGVQSAFVYLVNADNTVTVRPVELGQVDGERVIAKSGVALNDVVVTDGGDRLRDGAVVQLPEATAQEVAQARKQKQAEEGPQGSFPGPRGFPGNLTPEQRKRFEAMRKRRQNGGFPGFPGGGGPPGGFGRPPG